MVDRFEFEMDTSKPIEAWKQEVADNLARKAAAGGAAMTMEPLDCERCGTYVLVGEEQLASHVDPVGDQIRAPHVWSTVTTLHRREFDPEVVPH